MRHRNRGCLSRAHLASALVGAGSLMATGTWPGRLAAQTVEAPVTCGKYGTLNPAAPPQTAQFGFLVGQWDAQVWRRSASGIWDQETRRAYWEGHYILDGYAIADYWYDHRLDDRPDTHRGVNVRFFNTSTGVWDVTWQHTEDPLLIIHGEQRDGAMHLWTEQPDGSLARIVFSNIQPDSWDWLMEVSDDEGETWTPALRIRVERKQC